MKSVSNANATTWLNWLSKKVLLKMAILLLSTFVGSIDGVEFDGGKGENFSLGLGSGQFIPGFEDHW